MNNCPRCGAPLWDDGDRLYTDWCGECGWATKDRRRRDRLNDITFALARGEISEEQAQQLKEEANAQR